MITRLPGQKENMSPKLKELLKQAAVECKRNVKFSGVPRKGFLGRTEWRDNDILVEIKRNLTTPLTEYITAHELCHVLQLARCCAIASGRLDEPGAVTIASQITDFVLDPLADTMAIEYGLPMASGFKAWLESELLLEVLKQPRNGRRYGTNWHKVWEGLTRVRVCRGLGLKLPKPTKDFWTMYVALDLGRTSRRACNLGLSVGDDILESIKKVPLLSKVVNDLINIGSASNVEESADKIQSILNYFETEPGHIVINKPFTSEFLIEGQWQVRSSKDNQD